jgi:hypothetical protein
MNQSETDLGIVNESQMLRFGITPTLFRLHPSFVMERYRGRPAAIISHIWRHFVRAHAAAIHHQITSETSIPATTRPCVTGAVVVVVAAAVAAAGRFVASQYNAAGAIRRRLEVRCRRRRLPPLIFDLSVLL